MRLNLQDLPDDTALLHQIIRDLSDKLSSLSQEKDILEAQLALLKAKRFGKSSEKLDNQIAQLELKLEENEAAIESLVKGCRNDAEDNDSNHKTKTPSPRQPLPDHLEREEVTVDPDPTCHACGGVEFRKIADDISETLEYQPASFKVIRTIRPRCACTNCEAITQAEMPSKPIVKGKAGPGLLAHMLVQKYANHLPLYRQSQIYEREGIGLSRSTMASWVHQCSVLLSPLIRSLQSEVFASAQLHADDTPIRVLAPGLGKTKIGRLWAYVRDGRPCNDNTAPALCYYWGLKSNGTKTYAKDVWGCDKQCII